MLRAFGVIAHLIKFLPQEHEVMSTNPQTQYKKPGRVVYNYNLCVRGGGRIFLAMPVSKIVVESKVIRDI